MSEGQAGEAGAREAAGRYELDVMELAIAADEQRLTLAVASSQRLG